MSDLLPCKEGFYWAKWRIKDAGTEDENEPCSDVWEIVQVFVNCQDEKDKEYLRVFVGGVGRSQSLENFYWGEEVTRTPASNPVEEVSLETLNWMFKDVPVGGEAAFLMDNFKNGLKIVGGK